MQVIQTNEKHLVILSDDEEPNFGYFLRWTGINKITSLHVDSSGLLSISVEQPLLCPKPFTIYGKPQLNTEGI